MDKWVVIHNYVYDVSEFGRVHPGGDILYQFCGQDATAAFLEFH